jgi:hypothetical protein
MATVLAKEKVVTTARELTSSTSSLVSGHSPPLGAPREEKRFWFQRGATYDPNAIATQISVFDDPDTADKYQPRPDW